MEAIIEKIKEYKIIVICVLFRLGLGRILPTKASRHLLKTNLQAEVSAVSKDSSSEVNRRKRTNPLNKDNYSGVKGVLNHQGFMICQ